MNTIEDRIRIKSILPATSGSSRVGFFVVILGSGACKDARTRSISSTARRPSRRNLYTEKSIKCRRFQFLIHLCHIYILPSHN